MFRVLRSSAGAGKTHALVKHYLRLCLQKNEVSAYRQVLALTFTNKAASEMRERVVRYLEQLAQHDLSSPALRDVMDDMTAAGASEVEVAQRAGLVLRHMLHHWGEVAISTIDAFTRRVVRPFARDLQMDHDLRMSTEHAWYRQRAVESVVAEAGVNEAVTRLLTAACEQLLEDEARWDPGASLNELGKELDKEASIAPLASLHDLDASTVLALAERLRKETTAFQRDVRRIGEQALHVIGDARLKAEDLAHGKGGFHSYFSKLAGYGHVPLEPGANARKAFEGDGKLHGGKADAETKAVLERIGPQLRALYTESCALLNAGQCAYFVRDAVRRELPSAFALIELDRHLSALKEADGVAFFSDLTRRVAEVVHDEPAPFIFERIGERYRHFLLDEFQDTSLLQWRTLLPLIHNALSTGGSALLVGDAKQAIYRWRNGEVRLFTELPKLFPPAASSTELEHERALHNNYHAGEPLAANRRSASTIIHFNNRLFGALREYLPEELRQVYTSHEQEVQRKEPGLVRLERIPKDTTSEERASLMSEFLLRQVREAETDGFVPGDIAVLVRTAVDGQRAADALTAAGYSVTSPDGLRLGGHPLAECLMDLLLVLHASDQAAAVRVIQYRARFAASTDLQSVNPFVGTRSSFDPLSEVRAWLRANGDPRLRTTLTDLLARLAVVVGATSDAYLLTLLDEAHAFGVAHGQDIVGFVEHWERSGKKRNTNTPANARTIQVMTVHKAKGLEFPVVIMPSARMASNSNHAERIWVAPGEAVPELRAALVVKSAALRACAVPEILEEDGLSTLDDLDLLYVAFTRAVQRLYALVPSDRLDGLTKLLFAHVEAHGREGVLQEGERTQPWKHSPIGSSEELIPSQPRMHELAIRFEAPPEWSPADPDPLRRRGNVVHEVLGRVQHATDLERTIASAVNDGSLDPSDGEGLCRQLSALLNNQALIPWFGAHITARTEVSIIDASGNTHRPDRVVFDGDAVRVLDIKTGVPDDRHHDQVRRYMRLLAELGHTHVEGALLYVADGSLIPVAA
jgi:ATP-dependent exoDNAse (exonuclease V) beta subunit